MNTNDEGIKRKPGRPRKTNAGGGATEATARRGPGRPRKSAARAKRASDASRKSGTVAKRGPGRPRKVDGAPVERRGPGRPRKDETMAGEGKRGPGRPRKTQMNAISNTNTHAMQVQDVAVWMGDIGRHGLAFIRALLGQPQTAPLHLEAQDVLTTKEVAELVRTRESEVLHAIGRGDLRATKIGKKYRVTRHNVAVWLGG